MTRPGKELGISAIGVALPERRVATAEIAARLGVDPLRLQSRLGFHALARKDDAEDTTDLAVAAVQQLVAQGLDLATVDCLCAVTQNPNGAGIPSLAADLHGRLGLSLDVAAFDVAHGCSGYVYALALTQAFMAAQGLRTGLLVTCDPYSKIVDPEDYQTALIFGDAAAATLLTEDCQWRIGAMDFGTAGSMREALLVGPTRRLRMDGKRISRFCLVTVPQSIQRALARNGLTLEDVDEVLLHQASRYVVEAIGSALNASEKTSFHAAGYGNTVSSSLPIALARHVPATTRRVLISGFGVGLSWASTVLTRVDGR